VVVPYSKPEVKGALPSGVAVPFSVAELSLTSVADPDTAVGTGAYS